MIAVDLDGKSEVVVRVPYESFPFSIDWLPDGRLLIVSTSDEPLLRREPGGALVRMPLTSAPLLPAVGTRSSWTVAATPISTASAST